MPDLSLVERFGELERVLGEELVERSEEIRCALLALVAGKTFFMVGEPGIAKSMLARRIHAYIEGGRFFDHDMDKFSTPEDLFGPRDLSAMKEGRWERVVEGTILTAHWAMLDEFWEASSAVLKTLLRALNERDFHNGTEIISIPLTTVFCASNSVPVEERLMPLYDRLIIRRQLRHIQNGSAFQRMLGLRRAERPAPLLSWVDVERAQAEAEKVTIDESVLQSVVDIRRALAERDLYPSDRRFYEAMAVVRARAWLDGCDEAEIGHLRVLDDICWNSPSQIPEVTAAIDSVLEKLLTGVDQVMVSLKAIEGQIRDGLPDRERKQLAVELHDKVKKEARDLKALAASASTDRQRAKVAKAEELQKAVAKRIMEVLFQRKMEAS